MDRYLRATLYGTAFFIVQLANAAGPQLAQMAPKSQSLALSTLSSASDSLGMLGLVAWYAVLGLLTHVLPLLAATKIHADLARCAPPTLSAFLQRRGMVEAVLGTTLAAMAAVNWLIFPDSQALPHSGLVFGQSASRLLIYAIFAASTGAVAYWLVKVAARRTRVALVGLLALALLPAYVPTALDSRATPKSNPDVIIIGVDSLRPDHLHINGFPERGVTPNLDRFLGEAVNFGQTHTPQARTFVAYMSMLTGRYPVNNGVRENLYPLHLFDQRTSIAHDFRKAGYATAFAMDEARFANFSDRYGFDVVISPPPGAADFLFGSFIDTAGTNLLQLAPYAWRLMPHIVGNRAAANIYRPQAHNERLADAVDRVDNHKPLFLVSHFCIAHAPFVRQTRERPLPAPYDDANPRYRASLRVADQQVGQLLQKLRSAGRLENAIVVIVSDHGEALGMQKDIWKLPADSGFPMLRNYFGHGAPALDEAQTRVVLAIQRYIDAKPAWRPRHDDQASSLTDLAPTLLALAGLDSSASRFDGVKLIDEHGAPSRRDNRPIFMESGITGRSLQKAEVDAGEVANEFSHLYRLTGDLRFELSPDYRPVYQRMKQRAVVLGRYGLSSWPTDAGSSAGCWLVLDRVTLDAQCVPLDTGNPIVLAYRPTLCRQFRRDAQFFKDWCGAVAMNPAPNRERT